jgi:alanyl-tRNA synthetase
VTCFAGDADVPADVASVRRWQSLGISRIALLGRDDNWWAPAGDTGPCGPDTEIFTWIGDEPPHGFDPADRRWVEIWNDVFMEYSALPPTCAAVAVHRIGLSERPSRSRARPG